ncbi:MAG: hypothetical protein BWX92_04094 [Deltaproteobacteria bacterium ADurb.Bin135]|nr:MAG: hypothetical protein BWX92_04094 [Deltaproteobacteria bacterium ADurb.Bin135]
MLPPHHRRGARKIVFFKIRKEQVFFALIVFFYVHQVIEQLVNFVHLLAHVFFSGLFGYQAHQVPDLRGYFGQFAVFFNKGVYRVPRYGLRRFLQVQVFF